MKVLFALLWTSIALQIAFAAVGFVLRAPNSPLAVIEATIVMVGGSVYALVGAVLLWRRPEHRSGWLFAVAGFGWAVTDLAAGYGARAVAATPSWPAANVALWLDGGNGWPIYVSDVVRDTMAPAHASLWLRKRAR